MLLNQIKNIFKKAKLPLSQVLESAFKGGRIDDYDFIEEQLIISDIGMNTTKKIIERLKRRAKEGVIIGRENLTDELKKIIFDILKSPMNPDDSKKPLVILVSGINGAGKTTSIAKLANWYRKRGGKVILGAADTFRAAADEQLKIWAERTGSEIYLAEEKREPAAVAYGACKKAVDENYDVLIIDTAGRMHNNENLMKEIVKLHSVIIDKFKGVNIFSLLVIDSTNGKNALAQAIEFKKAAGVDAIFLTKMDGTAKGGNVITIADELALPITFIGTGEDIDDFAPFDKESFVNEII